MTAIVGAAILAPICTLAKEEVQTIPSVANGETFTINCSERVRLDNSENGALYWDNCTIHITNREKIDCSIINVNRNDEIFLLGNKLDVSIEKLSITNCNFIVT